MTPVAVRPMAPGEEAVCEGILRALPDWFGIEESIVQYARDLETMETWVAVDGEQVVGFLTLRRHTPQSAEIQVMAVLPSHHGRGLGRALVEEAECTVTPQGVQLLQVKTLGPSRPNEAYARTRGFYERLGFIPLEENRLWGAANPCLILVKPLRGS